MAEPAAGFVAGCLTDFHGSMRCMYWLPSREIAIAERTAALKEIAVIAAWYTSSSLSIAATSSWSASVNATGGMVLSKLTLRKVTMRLVKLPRFASSSSLFFAARSAHVKTESEPSGRVARR